MIKKVDPDSHSVFKKKILTTTIIIELFVITRAAIFFLYRFDPKSLSQNVGQLTLADIGLMIYYGTEAIGIIYIIYLKVQDLHVSDSLSSY